MLIIVMVFDSISKCNRRARFIAERGLFLSISLPSPQSSHFEIHREEK